VAEDKSYRENIELQIRRDISSAEISASIEQLRSKKIALFIVTFNAQQYIESVIKRIPKEIRSFFTEIFIIDDSSRDLTFEIATNLKNKYTDCNISVYRTPFNRGYGGNQKLGYLYCIKNNYDIVILLHGDGQYAPEYLPKIITSFNEKTDAVFASRMINKAMALRGGMPIYKWIGNQMLTFTENRLLGTHLSEFHTGYRAYNVNSLRKIPFMHNSDDFHFDTEIIIQLIATKSNIVEIPVPAYYGDETSHVNSLRYAKNCIESILKYHAVTVGLFYSRNFDFALFETENYRFKKSPFSLHQYILKQDFNNSHITIELGANKGMLSSYIADKVKEHWAIDIFNPGQAGRSKTKAIDLNNSFSEILPKQYFNCCLALDVVEHVNNPEKFLSDTFNVLKTYGKLYISTANISYFPMRLMLLFGQFNYGKRGILDKTHKRLYTISTFKQLLASHGFEIKKVVGFSPPLTDLISKNKMMQYIEKVHTFFSRLYPRLFAYNFLVIAERTDSLDEIFKDTIKGDSAAE
jgi:glycosyltransferase involved in cell wall biosynthesis